MKEEKNCEHCNGIGKIEVSFCDKCGLENRVDEYEGQQICHLCWVSTLTEEEINNF